MDVERVKESIGKRYEGIVEKKAYGETTYFYNPNYKLKNGIYVCTIKENDGPNDKAGNLSREGVYRISTGLTKAEYVKRFGSTPRRPKKGEVVDLDINLDIKFDDLNVIMPHPIYSWMGWICVNNPEQDCFDNFFKCIDLSYNRAIAKYKKRAINLGIVIGNL